MTTYSMLSHGDPGGDDAPITHIPIEFESEAEAQRFTNMLDGLAEEYGPEGPAYIFMIGLERMTIELAQSRLDTLLDRFDKVLNGIPLTEPGLERVGLQFDISVKESAE